MSDDERVLRSFVAEDEEWLGSWTVTQVTRSKGRLPPTDVGEETVGLTDDRLLWFANELNEVRRDDLEEIDSEHVERQASHPIVLGGGLLLVVGSFASIGAFVAGVGDSLVVAVPVLTGLAAFLGARLFASATDRKGERREGYRLRVWVDGDPVSIWGHDEERMDALEAAVRSQVTPRSDETSNGLSDPTETKAEADGASERSDDSPSADAT